MVGASRERVNKAIASFVRLGWIDQTERRYRSSTASSSRRRAPAESLAEEGDGPRARRRRRRRRGGRAAVVVDEAVVGALVAHDRDAGRLGRRDVVGRCPLVDRADDGHGRAGALGG